jgi:hypothetical protein
MLEAKYVGASTPEAIGSKKVAKYLNEDHAPRLRLAYQAKRVLRAVPVGVSEVALSGALPLISFVFQFGAVRGVMPMHEVGVPVWPETCLSFAGKNTKEMLDLYLALNKKDKGKVMRRMVSIMGATHPLPFLVTAIDDKIAVLSRVAALATLKQKVVPGEEIAVIALGISSYGVVADYKGSIVHIPREEVFYGQAPPHELLKVGECYMAKVLENKHGLITASTKAVSPDPWDSFEVGVGSVCAAQIRGLVKGTQNIYRVEYMPGITGLAQGSPLITYQNEQTVAVRIYKVDRERRYIKGFIDA